MIHEDTHVLVAHNEGRVSSWPIARYARTRTFWKKRTVRGESDWGTVGYASIRTSRVKDHVMEVNQVISFHTHRDLLR